MANTFLLAEGKEVGMSQIETECKDIAKEIIKNARQRMKTEKFDFYLPSDVVVAKKRDSISKTRVVDISQHSWSEINSYPKTPPVESYTIQPDEIILDIGPMSAASIAGSVKLAKTVIWNGLAGVVEIKGINGASDPFAHGTKTITDVLSGVQSGDGSKPYTVAGGGDTVAYIESVEGLRDRLGHVSTGGGAVLELLAGNKLIGIEALLDK
jgi:phosphoglycerate kinase